MILLYHIRTLSLGQTLPTFHYTLLDKCRALLSVVERGWPNALDFSLHLELNIPRMYYWMNNSFMECFVHYLMNSNCTCVHSTTLDNFALDQTSLDKRQGPRLHSTRWPNALDISLHLELNIPRMYYLMNDSFMECFVHYLMNSNCACVRSTTLDNFALDQTSLDKSQSSRLHSTRWPNALDISLNMHVERCIVKSRERLTRASDYLLQESNGYYKTCAFNENIDRGVLGLTILCSNGGGWY